MRIREYKQTNTSPLKYIIEMNEKEMEHLQCVKMHEDTESLKDCGCASVVCEILSHLDKIEKRTNN